MTPHKPGKANLHPAEQRVLFVGSSGTGKTTLAAHYAQLWQRHGAKVVAFDPYNRFPFADRRFGLTPGGLGVRQGYQIFEVGRVAQGGKRLLIVVDELLLASDDDNTGTLLWLATQSRNQGHRVWFVGQRATMAPPTIRNNCGGVIAFRVSPDDARQIANDYALDDPKAAADAIARLDVGEHVEISTGKVSGVRKLHLGRDGKGTVRAVRHLLQKHA